MEPSSNTFSKEERLCGKTSVSALINDGRWGSTTHFRYCWKQGRESGVNRILVSVPKKFFKRAVRRNLLKRRIREAYRTRKDLAEARGIDILFSYSSKECADYGLICMEVESILSKIDKHRPK